ncbi:MAG: GNAT family N-acetyltransferase [Caldilineae bacterium]|nr:GNAT family N-acetyltransferase [Caldilineae bacterium]
MDLTPQAAFALPDGYSVRPPRMEDAQVVLALLNACDVAEYGEPDSDLEDFIFDWESADLVRDAWLVDAPDGSLAGYGLVSHWSGGFQADFYARPALQEIGLQGWLLEQCERRLREMLASLVDVPPQVSAFAAHVNQADRDALNKAGYAPKKYHFRMQIDMTERPPEPEWPDGCYLRAFHPGEDDEELYRFIQTAFDAPGRTPPLFEEWRDFMMRPDHFVPDLWFLLYSQGNLVGTAVCYDYGPYGWVRHLAVADDRRRQGIGSALLRHVFGEFYLRGKMRVALGVEASNENAYRLYERVGMRRVRQFDEYHKQIG